MKKLLIGVGVAVALLVLAALALPVFISASMLKDKAAESVRQSTGRTLAINGPVSLRVFPSIELDLRDVTFSNPAWAKRKAMASLKALSLGLDLWPLLSGNVVVNRFHLVEPVINLEISPSGEANWVMGAQTPANDKPLGQKMADMLAHFSLRDVSLEHGQISYADARSHASYLIGDANLALDLRGLDDPLQVTGDVVFNNQKVVLSLKLDKLGDLLTGPGTPAQVSLDAAPLKASFNGKAGGDAIVAGDVTLASPALGQLALWLNPKGDMKPGQYANFSLKGKLTARKNQYDFDSAGMAFDAVAATGAMTLNTAGKRPALKGRLAIDDLDVNPYLPAQAAPAGTSPGAAPADWSDAPIDSSSLKALDMDLALTLGGLKVRDISVGKSDLNLAVADGVLTADLTQMALYGGTGRAKVIVRGRSSGVGVSGDLAFNVKNAGALLKDAVKFSRLDGAGAITASLSADGASQRALIQSLGGHGDFRFVDGKIAGFNLAGAVRKAASLGFDRAAVTDRATDFAELSASFVIDHGRLVNKDLKLVGPLVRATGGGAIDLPARTIDYRLEPKLVASLQGQGGVGDLAGLELPVKITGNLWAPTIAPDLAALAKNPMGAIQGAKGLVDSLKGAGRKEQDQNGGGLGGALKGLFGQ